MQILEFFFILRRRWFYLVLGLSIGLLAGFLTAPGSGQSDRYQATHQMLVRDEGSDRQQQLNLGQIELVVTTGAVPADVAKRLEAEDFPPLGGVETESDQDLRSLDITAYSSTPSGAERAADLFAEELNESFVESAQAARDQALAEAEEQATALDTQLDDIDQQLAALAPTDPSRVPLLDAQRSVASSLFDVRTEIADLEGQGGGASPLRTLESGEGVPEEFEGWRIPDDRPVRAAMLGVLGLILGAVGALAADRLDTRVRNKVDAERAFDLPVVAEVPPLPGGAMSRELLVATRPAAPIVEAYRALRTVILFTASSMDAAVVPTSNGHVAPAQPVPPEPVSPEAKVIVITSPSAGEGKTTTVAHLAAVLAEFGERVLVVSADFRRPRVHEHFEVPREPGLSDVLTSGSSATRLSDLQMSTNFDGVHLIPSGAPVGNPAQLLTESMLLISAARGLFDYIVVDTPPLLVANDATELAAAADMVIVVAKADRTGRDSARRTTETLQRVDAPILGVVITAAHDTPIAYGYYRHRYYAEADQGVRGPKPARRWPRRSKPVDPLPPADERQSEDTSGSVAVDVQDDVTAGPGGSGDEA